MICPWAKHEDDDWVWAFLHDRKLEGGAMKWFTLTDDNTQECLALEVRGEMTAETVNDVLTADVPKRGKANASATPTQRWRPRRKLVPFPSRRFTTTRSRTMAFQ
jgi:transposase InsO family protein